jgi:hypothetical protein
MPPAFVLSQNQTLKLMYDPAGWNNPVEPASLGAVFLHKNTNWCVCVY